MNYKLCKRRRVNGLYYFVLKHNSGLIVMRSDTEYSSTAALESAVKSVSKLMPGITVEQLPKKIKKQKL